MHSITRSAVLFSLFTVGYSASATAFTTYNVQFFDPFGAAVGSGSFITDPAKTICVDSGEALFANCNPNAATESSVLKSNPLTAFNATVLGKSWTLMGEKIWWVANGQVPGQQSSSRGFLSVVDNAWEFGGPNDGPGTAEQLDVTIGQATSNGGTGTWVQEAIGDVVFDDGTIAPGLLRTEGSWTVTAAPVPLPAGWLLLATVLVPGLGRMALRTAA